MLFFLIGALALLIMGTLIALFILYPSGVLESQQAKHISISADGIEYASPQTATLYATMNGSGESPAIAASSLAVTINEFNFTVLKYIGGNSSGITTQSYSLQKVYNKTEYQATESVLVSIPSIDNVSPVLSALSSVSNVYVNQVTAQLSGSQTAAMIKGALVLAVQNATAQAQAIAGNSTLIIDNISVYGNQIYPYAFAASAPAANGEQLYFNGRHGVKETVSVEFSYR